MPRILTPFVALLLAAAPALSQEANPNIRFGMPAPAKADPILSREAFLISRPQYVLSYNAKTRTPNWVCWRLRADDIGNAPRAPFEPDPALPRGSSLGSRVMTTTAAVLIVTTCVRRHD